MVYVDGRQEREQTFKFSKENGHLSYCSTVNVQSIKMKLMCLRYGIQRCDIYLLILSTSNQSIPIDINNIYLSIAMENLYQSITT